MKEIWKDIEGYEGLYQISNLGRVKSLRKNIIMKSFLRGSRANNRYSAIQLNKDAKTRTFSVHRLVAKAFIPNPNNYEYVNHKNENKTCNEYWNLEWCNSSYNRIYSINKGSIKYKTGEKNKLSKLTDNEVRWIRKNYKSQHKGNVKSNSLSLNEIARIFNVSKRTILDIVHNKKYKDVDLNKPIKYKFFVYSDVHGCFTELQKALRDAGFDINNPLHKIIDCSDSFDRGSESLSVYEWYKSLEKDRAVVLMGNHFPFLINYLNGTSLSPFNYQYNGVNETLADFLHETKPFETWCLFNNIESPTIGDFGRWIEIARNQINEEYPELLPWLKSLPYYYESQNYIFTHGAIDTEVEDWHKPHCFKGHLVDWEALAFDDGTFFGKHITNTDKTVVIGHFGTEHLRRLYNIEDGKDKNDILVREDCKVIAIDATTCVSHKVNVLVVEDEILE